MLSIFNTLYIQEQEVEQWSKQNVSKKVERLNLLLRDSRKHNVLVRMLRQHKAWGEGSLSDHCLPLDMIRLAAGSGLRVKSCSCQLSESSQPKTHRANI